MLWFLIVAAFSYALCKLFLYLLYPPLTKELTGFNGPPRYPIVGNMFDALQRKTPEDMWSNFMKHCTTYKSPMLTQIGPEYTVVMYDAEQLEGLMKSSVNIDKSWPYDFSEGWLGKGLLTSTGEHWHRKRKMLTPAFHFNILKDFVPIFNEQSQVLVDILAQHANSGQAIDVCSRVTRCTLDIICESAMGKKLQSQNKDSDYVQAIYRFADITIKRIVRPWQWNDWIMKLFPSGQELLKCQNILHSFTWTVIAEREATFKNFQSGNAKVQKERRLAFLDLLLSLKQDGKISDEEIREEVDTFMFEGHDTTSAGISWTLYTIGRHPQVQRKIHQELQSIFGNDFNRAITVEDVHKMVYLECVIKETQRLLPSVPFISRSVTEPFTIPDGQVIPKGVRVDIVIQRLHRDPKHFPDPLNFDPDRFLPENCEGRHPFAFMPFSAGPRNCIGQKFAMLEEKIVLSSVLRRFRLESTQSFEEVKPAMQLVLRPMQGLWIRFFDISQH